MAGAARDDDRFRLHDVTIHGLGLQGMNAGRISNWTMERVKLNANGWAGWDANVGSNSSNSGAIVMRDIEIAWNGCTERYPSTTGDARTPTGRISGGLLSAAVQSGYRDGLVKGREDADDRDSYDPNRHSWYRSADRGYESRFGTKQDYQMEYRRGFLEGYNAVYRRQ
jgi:hypothetical protein